MTSSSVSNIASTLTLAQGVESNNISRSKQDFDLLLNQKTSVNEEKVPVSENANSLFPQAQQSYEKVTTESGYKDTPRISEKGADDSAIEQAKDGYQELKENVVQKLTEKLEVSEEELLEAMSALGITFENLLQGNGLKELMMEFTGTKDVTDLLVNDVFQDLMQELDGLVQNFINDMSISPEEFEKMLQQIQTEVFQENDSQEFIFIQEDNQVQDMNALDVDGQKDIASVDADENGLHLKSTENETQSLQTENLTENQMKQETVAIQQEDGGEMSQKQMYEGKETEAFSKTDISYDASQNQVTFQTIQTTVNSAGQEVVQIVERAFVDVENIMNQIVEFTKVTVGETQSSIEMQLNPEHLGKIYMQVVSKEGVITAQLAAQNEAVQQALESQVALLKENMNQQGLKIDAVEVTIASHEFEQNLERDGQQEAQDNLEKETRKSQRFISVNQLDELAGLMTEEESLVAKMMLENGNSMDMTA